LSSIEDIILQNDRRGISKLRGFLPSNYCDEAAELIRSHPGRALILTGFYIVGSQAPETDGPPGAYYLGKALESLGYKVTHVTDVYTSFLFRGLVSDDDIIDFPIADAPTSEGYAIQLLDQLQPSIVISTERCGLTAQDRYLNMRGIDISPYNAMLDYLVTNHDVSVGIGDGGNEIGMGNLEAHIPAVDSLPDEPTATKVTKLVLASVSNWGAYGLIAALSKLSGISLLPQSDEESHLIQRMVDQGAVDGYLSERAYSVDGFSLEENQQLLQQLHKLLADLGISGVL